MSCEAIAPNLSLVEQGQFLEANIPKGLFRAPDAETGGVPWRIAPEPFPLAQATVDAIEALGSDLLAFYRTLNTLYTRSARGTAPAFVADYLDRGKPEHIVKLARQNRFRGDLPGVIRPDLILTEGGGFIASEFDSIPGGMGFVGAMAEQYCKLGYDTVGGANGMADSLAAMLAATAKKPHPVVGIIVSEESADYREELRWIAQRITERDTATVYVAAPGDVVFTEQALFVRLQDGREEKIDVLYRNFELFDLLNVPKQELMLYAARHNRVAMTPPPKAQFEEKLAFALLHHPALTDLWRGELGKDVYARLSELMPQTWVLDPRPLPPQASIYGLSASGRPVFNWNDLAALGKSERDYVVKPSGFSEMAWGSRGVQIANDLTKDDWAAAIRDGLAAFESTPHILQRFRKGRRVKAAFWERLSDTVVPMDGRVRLTPYYFVVGEQTQLGGILATVVPADKRLIHGMKDAIMTPCMLREGGN